MSHSRQNELNGESEKEKVDESKFELAQAQRTLSKSEEDVGAPAMSEEGASPSTGLPFSRARCIALVWTVTGASILNVCCASLVDTDRTRLLIDGPRLDFGCPGFGHHSADYWESSEYTG
jgi:hypothetical protein